MRVGLSSDAKREGMNAPDLRQRPPRRWSDAVAGIIWLPRLIDKARAYDAGTLGSYLYGQSPVDDTVLHRAGLNYPGLLAIVRRCPTDAEVLAEIERASAGATARLREWSILFPQRRAMQVRVYDIDEGYVNAWWTGPVRAVGNAVFVPVSAALRALRPVQR
ncbi:MAG: hypothetical protein NVSMB5_16620 [Candidatus Velthaea sp.]